MSFTNALNSALRIQINGPNGPTLASDRWCYELVGSSGTVTIPYGEFNTSCWDGAGTYYAGEPLAVAQLLIPGQESTTTPFDVCLTGLRDGP